MDVCKRQLFHLIDRMERVEVNNEEIDIFMPQISAKLSYLSKEEIISRFVSLEFNRFAEYYKDAEDINVDVKEGKKGKDRDSNRSKRGQKVRFKMLYGTKQNATPRSVLGVINDVTQDKSIIIGDIEITNKFTFFDVYADQADQVRQAFEAAGEPLSIAEPREVVSKAPKGKAKDSRHEARDTRRDVREKRDESRDNRRDKEEHRGRERRNERRDRDERYDRRENRRRDVAENPDKPWRKRR